MDHTFSDVFAYADSHSNEKTHKQKDKEREYNIYNFIIDF